MTARVGAQVIFISPANHDRVLGVIKEQVDTNFGGVWRVKLDDQDNEIFIRPTVSERAGVESFEFVRNVDGAWPQVDNGNSWVFIIGSKAYPTRASAEK